MSTQKTKKWVIVKNASIWQHHYDDDPMKGVLASHSCHDTPTGQQLGIKPIYTDLAVAEIDTKALNAVNCGGRYAACPVIE